MSQTSHTNGDAPAALNGSDAEHATGRLEPAAAARVHHAPPAPGPAMKRRTGHALDYRRGSLRTGATRDVPVAARRTDHGHRRYRPLLATLAIFVVVASLAVVLIQSFVVQTFSVAGDAMTPTLHTGDRILVLKPSFLRGSIHPGDIVVVRAVESLPCSVTGSGDLVLRVAAVPGSVIASVGSSIVVDGRPLRERGRYDPRFGEVGSTPIRRTTLAAGRYYVLADNRSNACDSRTFGAVPASSIVGQGVAVVGRQGHVSLGTL